MLYDRSYMRPQETPSIKSASAVTILLIATIGAFVLQQVINVSFPNASGSAFLDDWVALNVENFKELKVWTVVTYAFLHEPSALLHILGNMLGLFFIGRIVEPLLGKQNFFLLYFSGAVMGGLAYIFFHLNDIKSVIGASAAVSAILAFFCMRFPERSITLLLFFVIPLTVKPKWIFWVFLGISTFSLLFFELPSKSAGTAHSAHLGGFLTGVVYFRYIYNRQSIYGSVFSRTRVELPHWLKRLKKQKPDLGYQVNRPTRNRDELQTEVDRILDKINASGFGSLSASEKGTLEKAKELLNR